MSITNGLPIEMKQEQKADGKEQQVNTGVHGDTNAQGSQTWFP